MRMKAILALVVAAAMVPGVAAATDLTPYVGKYPFDKVAKRNIFQVPGIKQQFEKAFGKGRWATLQSYATAIPIEQTQDDALGQVLVIGQCKPHDCENSARVLIEASGKVIGACFVDFGIKSGTVTWLGNGWHKRAATTAIGACGETAAAVVARFKAAAPARH